MKRCKTLQLLMLFITCLAANKTMAYFSDSSLSTLDRPQHFSYPHPHYPLYQQSHSYGYQPHRDNHYRPPLHNSCRTRPRYRRQHHRRMGD